MKRNLFVCLIALFFYPAVAEANRPFMTDDAGVAGVGEVEVQLWSEFTGGDVLALAPIFHLEAAFSPLSGLEFTLGGGLGWGADDGALTLVNPLVEAKAVFLEPEGLRPGVGFLIGAHPPLGFGEAFTPATTIYGIVPLTLELPGDQVAIHANVGWVSAFDEGGFQIGRPVAGLGAEWAVGGGDVALIAEVFFGDPGDVGTGIPAGFFEGPFEGQVGFRWDVAENFSVDGGVIADPSLEVMVHTGVVVVFDTGLGR